MLMIDLPFIRSNREKHNKKYFIDISNGIVKVMRLKVLILAIVSMFGFIFLSLPSSQNAI